jgi:hypothetical protein
MRDALPSIRFVPASRPGRDHLPTESCSAARRHCGQGGVCSPNHATPVHKETSHVAVHSS